MNNVVIVSSDLRLHVLDVRVKRTAELLTGELDQMVGETSGQIW